MTDRKESTREALEVIAEEAMQARHYGRPLDPLWTETTAREALGVESHVSVPQPTSSRGHFSGVSECVLPAGHAGSCEPDA